jgi:hypothetical protein
MPEIDGAEQIASKPLQMQCMLQLAVGGAASRICSQVCKITPQDCTALRGLDTSPTNRQH